MGDFLGVGGKLGHRQARQGGILPSLEFPKHHTLQRGVKAGSMGWFFRGGLGWVCTFAWEGSL